LVDWVHCTRCIFLKLSEKSKSGDNKQICID
jgi:hypothetical protein